MGSKIFLSKKVFKNKFNLITVVLLVLAIGICFFFNNKNANQYSYQNDAMRQVNETESNISELRRGNNQQDKEHQQINQSNINEQEKILKTNKQRLRYIRNGEFQKSYNIDIAQTQKDYTINKNSPGDSSSSDLGIAIKRDNLRFKYLKQNHLRKDSDYYPNKSLSFMKWALQNLVPILFTICLIFILSQIFTDSYIDKINISKLLPYSKKRQYISNITFGLIISYSTLILFLLLSFAVGLIFGGGISARYPFLSWTSNQNMFFQSTMTVFWKSTLLTILSICFLIELVYLIGYLVRNKFATLFINLLLICGLISGVYLIEPLQKIAKFIPTTYFNSVGVVSGQFSKQISNFSVNYQSGIICLLVSIIFIFILTMIVENELKKY